VQATRENATAHSPSSIVFALSCKRRTCDATEFEETCAAVEAGESTHKYGVRNLLESVRRLIPLYAASRTMHGSGETVRVAARDGEVDRDGAAITQQRTEHRTLTQMIVRRYQRLEG
jgi:hypothetical protein